ncbi:unnamed protein product [Pleuronectes platessa]|uniref:Uncharacterized protein n=1 Tax=Pleuronectes platessa TaxID=8262 RepID=A0A9N7YRI1_PLEPL|nr:unnamed protein product [Pleuronectes platessa]
MLIVHTDHNTVLTLYTELKKIQRVNTQVKPRAPVQTATDKCGSQQLSTLPVTPRHRVGSIAAPISNLTRLHRGFLSPRPPRYHLCLTPRSPPSPAHRLRPGLR